MHIYLKFENYNLQSKNLAHKGFNKKLSYRKETALQPV